MESPDIVEALLQEMHNPAQWMYLSFAGEHFNGVAIVQAHGITDAAMKCYTMGIFPGGQVACWVLPQAELPAEQYRNRLLSKEDIKTIWPEAKSLREWEAQDGLV